MKKFNINGSQNPSRADVIDAFARAYDRGDTTVSFHGDGSFGLAVQVTGLGYESGAPGMFLVSGFSTGTPVKGYYDANRRVGYLEIG